ncbi:hypothetical protein AA0111_g9305 [Alternaria arborescens]|nr:hypothetical protein AA0111_g9305 [Alternaria arborescens]RYO22770.1 hypothetical protein AA0111_g9305 [Alternaria arborescens]
MSTYDKHNSYHILPSQTSEQPNATISATASDTAM